MTTTDHSQPRPRSRRRRRLGDDRGAISPFVAIVTVPLFLLGGLLAVDAFGVSRAHERTDAAATEAARAAAQAIDPAKAVAGEAVVADPNAASAAARAYLARADVRGTVTVTDGGHRIEVHATGSYRGRFVPHTWTVTATSSATLLHGITRPTKD
ncbi:pilus assembly protein TadG-related protein [Streptomyces sp. TLI_105]|uniref:pilus assembly protein TadG-related protein n=1 Tax=Streptomyces sp. TLI_105 TaxID=1881019 RepID=UPI0008964BC5|nr:pilus assembly protein TadG-related protein [Streptomyces sp. TLI_105]SEE57666.1 Flp pilus assembly protein TadG [Streptomyces sp. TLI_105]